MTTLRIDPKIRGLIPPLTADERSRLEASILREGIREPITTYKGAIADGHNRYKIAQQHGLEFDVAPLPTAWSEDDVRAWVIENQLARRNLTPFQRAELVLALRDVLAAEAKDRMSRGGKGKATLPDHEKGQTRDKLAEQAGVSPRTMDKIAFLADNADEETLGRLRRGETTPHKEFTRLQSERRKAEAVAAVESKPQPLPDGPFDVIVADPPWSFFLRTGDPSHRNQEPYPPMRTDEIADLPVGELAAPDSILWLWTTNAHLLDGSAAKVLDAWGFTPKTMLTWFKTQIGAGHWLRGQTEHCIFATRGKPAHTLAGESTALEGDFGLALKTGRREHSRKPDEFFAIVESVCPGSKVELFAREQREGWYSWGAEKEKFGVNPSKIECPKCHAAPGERCKSTGALREYSTRGAQHHVAREKAAARMVDQ